MVETIAKRIPFYPCYPVVMAAVDYVAIVISVYLAMYARNGILFMTGTTLHIPAVKIYVLIPLIYILFLQAQQLYTVREPFYALMRRIMHASAYAMGATIAVIYFSYLAEATSRLFMGLFWVTSIILLLMIRYICLRIFEKIGVFQIPLLIIGAGQTGELFYKNILKDSAMNYEVIGVLEDYSVKGELLKNVPVLGKISDAVEVIKKYHIKSVVIAAPGMEQEKLAALIFAIHPIVKSLSIIPNLVGIPMGNVQIDSFYKEKLMAITVRNNLQSSRGQLIKRIFDLILSLMGTVLISVFLAVIAVLIRLDSPGPVIYDGKRIGKDGKVFKCYKFRTMYTNGPELLQRYFAQHPDKKAQYEIYHKLDCDPRITRIGRFLRKTSLDELPQFINVILGDMSLVGPRPYLVEEQPEMGDTSGLILMTRPGITGFWQVSGRSAISFKERLMMDCWYVRNWSVWIDFYLLLKTVEIVILRKGAY